VVLHLRPVRDRRGDVELLVAEDQLRLDEGAGLRTSADGLTDPDRPEDRAEARAGGDVGVDRGSARARVDLRLDLHVPPFTGYGHGLDDADHSPLGLLPRSSRGGGRAMSYPPFGSRFMP